MTSCLFIYCCRHFHCAHSPTSSWIMLPGHWSLFLVWPVVCQAPLLPCPRKAYELRAVPGRRQCGAQLGVSSMASKGGHMFQTRGMHHFHCIHCPSPNQSGHVATPYPKCPLVERVAPEGSYLLRLNSNATLQVSVPLTSHIRSVSKNCAFTPIDRPHV